MSEAFGLMLDYLVLDPVAGEIVIRLPIEQGVGERDQPYVEAGVGVQRLEVIVVHLAARMWDVVIRGRLRDP